MLRNYLTIAIRNILRNKLYTAINALGLSVGIASCLLIFLYVQAEMGYNQAIPEADREDVVSPRGTRFFREVRPEGWEGELLRMPILEVGEDYLDTFEIDLVRGRNFSREIASDTTDAIIVNETLVKQMGWDDPIGKWIGVGNRKRHVVGAVRDFHIKSLHQPITPCGIIMQKKMFGHLALRVRGDNFDETEAFLKNTWRRFMPNRPFRLFHMDNWLQGAYYEERRLGKVLNLFSALAIWLACLGLFGLSSHMAQRRRREIGIRKALGATVSSIVLLLSRRFAYLVLSANLLAWPLAYVVLRNWLENFVYRISLGPRVFLIGGAVALFVALVTVSYHTLKSATSNPVDALRY